MGLTHRACNLQEKNKEKLNNIDQRYRDKADLWTLRSFFPIKKLSSLPLDLNTLCEHKFAKALLIFFHFQ